MEFRQSNKLSEVCYEIRGPVIDHANALEEAGHSVLRMNTGNPALFGFEAPEEIVQDMIRMLPQAHGYTDSRGILSARRAVAQRYQALGLPDVTVDDVFLGNGVSELISMAVQALLEDGDEVLVPAPDFPLWTAVTTLAERAGCALSVRRVGGLVPGPRRHGVEDHRPHQGRGDHQPQQPHRSGVSARDRRGHPRSRPPPRPDGLRRRDLRPDRLRRRRPPLGGRPRARPGRPHLQRSVQVVPGGGFGPAGWSSPGPSSTRRAIWRG